MFLSKHHYSVALAKLGNKVYYMGGPDQNRIMKPGEVQLVETSVPGVLLINHRLNFPYIFKFKARKLYDYLLKKHIKKITSLIGRDFDIVWSFDFSNTIPLKAFSDKTVKILTAADDSDDISAVKAAETADLILSVADELLNKYSGINTPTHNIGHGVAAYFLNDNISEQGNDKKQVGLSGNFLRKDIDHKSLLSIINEHQDVEFNFWGSVDYAESNISAEKNNEVLDFISDLKRRSNVVLHGQLAPEALAKAFKRVDCFLICYDVDKDQSKGTNYHKILEYLASGKVVVSNYVSAYKHNPELVLMPDERNNENLPALFREVLNNLSANNSKEKQQNRVDFARQFTYASQIKKIESLLA